MEQQQEGHNEVRACVRVVPSGSSYTQAAGGMARAPPSMEPTPTLTSPRHNMMQVVVNFRHITEMENHGVNRTDINKLMEAGYCTVESVRACVRARALSCRVGNGGRVGRGGSHAPVCVASARTDCFHAC
jgi:hypothetical protein